MNAEVFKPPTDINELNLFLVLGGFGRVFGVRRQFSYKSLNTMHSFQDHQERVISPFIFNIKRNSTCYSCCFIRLVICIVTDINDYWLNHTETISVLHCIKIDVEKMDLSIHAVKFQNLIKIKMCNYAPETNTTDIMKYQGE